MKTETIRAIISGAALMLTIGGGILAVKLDVQRIDIGVASLQKSFEAFRCEVKPTPYNCEFHVGSLTP